MAVREPNPIGGYQADGMGCLASWESWTWPGHEGKDIEVEVYSKYPAVRLYVNGALVGEKQTGVAEEFKALFTLPYAPGEIRAVGIEKGEEKESTVLQTAGTGKMIALSADRDEIAADGQDLSYITVHITDENGLIDPNASNKLAFEIEGPGRIVAVDNANLKDSGSYVANSRDAWKGKALVIVRSTGDAGVISLKVTSPDLKGSTITIQTIGR